MVGLFKWTVFAVVLLLLSQRDSNAKKYDPLSAVYAEYTLDRISETSNRRW